MITSEFIITLLYFAALYLVSRWLQKRMPDACHCDDSNQGRDCRNCTPPRLPRGNR